MALNVVGIVCALAAEARHLGPATRRNETVASLADGSLLVISGMGVNAAARAASALIEAGATALVSWGMAGGLDPTLPAGAILIPVEIVGLDGESVATARDWCDRLSGAIAQQRPVVRGKLLTSPTAIGSTARKVQLFQSTGAAAVDMESLAVALAAGAHGVPFIAVRVIVDSAGDSLPAAVVAAADTAGQLHIWRLIAALARAPSNLAPLIRLAKRYRAANRSLAAVARAGSLAPTAFAPVVAPTIS